MKSGYAEFLSLPQLKFIPSSPLVFSLLLSFVNGGYKTLKIVKITNASR